VSELIKFRPELQNFPKEITTKEYVGEDDDDEEEHYKDVDDEDEHYKDADEEEEHNKDADEEEEEGSVKKDETDTNQEVEKKKTSTWVHRKISHSKSNSKSGYDPLARNPLFARAEQSGGMWELHLLTSHFHPLVVNLTVNSAFMVS
jgi:ribosome biogenesis protein MAK21